MTDAIRVPQQTFAEKPAKREAMHPPLQNQYSDHVLCGICETDASPDNLGGVLEAFIGPSGMVLRSEVDILRAPDMVDVAVKKG